MKAVQIVSPEKVQILDVEKPALQPDEVLLKIEYVGFCGSDLNTFLGKNPMVKMPIIPGHEIGAVIEETGSLVPQELHPGLTVTVNPYTNCGKCASCRNRRYNACEHNETLGVQRNGAMCGYIAVPWEKVIPADGMNTRDCALIEPMSVGMGAIIRAALRGATVVAVDLDDEKLALAKEVGATHTINSRTTDVHEEMIRISQGFGADVVIEAVGNPVTYNMAINEVSFTGRVVYIGYAKSEVSFQTKLFVQKELNICGSRNALPEDFRAVIHYLNTHNFPYDKFISRIVTPEEAGEALQIWAAAPQKVFRILADFR